MLYSTGSGKVNVNIKLPTIGGESFEIIERNPQYVDVKLEKVETVQKPVKVALVGEPKDGFVTSQPKQTPSTIQIKGASSTIAKVDTVRVYADVSGATSDIDVSAEPRVYDAEGNELLGLELSVEYVKVKVGINEYKKVTIDGSANQGMLADGYTVTAIEWEPKTIEVVGSTNEINAFTELKLPSINLSGLKENKVVIYDLRTLLPANISIRNGTPYEAKVTVKVEKEAIKQVDIPIANLTVSGLTSSTQQYKIVQEPVKISLKGLSSVLDKVTITDIKGNIDISQYTQGVYDVPVKWTLPQGTVLVGNTPTVNVTISAVSQETKTKVETKASTQ
jgi:YbbR domain-containing protein